MTELEKLQEYKDEAEKFGSLSISSGFVDDFWDLTNAVIIEAYRSGWYASIKNKTLFDEGKEHLVFRGYEPTIKLIS